MAYHIELWDNVECASGATRQSVIAGIIEAEQRLTLTSDEGLTLTAPRFDHTGTAFPWVQDAVARNVVRVEDDVMGDVWEWRISKTIEWVGQSGVALVTVKADPILLDLRSEFILRFDVTGGLSYRNLGLVKASAHQYIDTFILNHPECPAWWARGTIDSTDWLDIGWDGFTPLELCRELEAGLGGDIKLRFYRNGSTNYQIQLTDVGSSDTGPPVEFGRNIIELQRQVDINKFATVILPRGRKGGSSIEFAGIADNVWEITAISGAGPYTITLADPEGGDGPIGFDDQWVGDQLKSATATDSYEEIDDSDATNQTVEVTSDTDFAVGDHISIVADTSGTRLSLVERPDTLATYGRVTGIMDVENQSGERNYLRGPFSANDWDDWEGWNQYIVICKLDGAHAATTTVDLKELKEGVVIAAGDLIHLSNSTTNPGTTPGGPWDSYVSTGGGDTVGADGLAQLTVNDAVTGSDGEYVTVWLGAVQSDAWWPGIHNWTADLDDLIAPVKASGANYSLGHMTSIAFAKGWADGRDLNGTVDGDQLSNGNWYIDVTGLDTNTWYPPYATVVLTDDLSAEYTRTVRSAFKTDGSGDARLFLSSSITHDYSDGNSAVLSYPADPQTYGMPCGEYVQYFTKMIDTYSLQWLYTDNEILVDYVAGLATVNFAVGYTVIYETGVTFDQTATGANHLMPKFTINARERAPSTASQGSGTFYADSGSYSCTADVPLHVDFTGSVTITEDARLDIELWHHRQDGSGWGALSPMTFYRPYYLQAIRYLSVWIGDSVEPPIIAGSRANTLWQKANTRLSDVGTPPVRYSIRLKDLAQLAGFDESAEKLTLGMTVPVTDERLGIDIDARITGIAMDLVKPGESMVTLESNARLATERLLNPRFSVRRSEALFDPAEGSTSIGTHEVEGSEVKPSASQAGAYRGTGLDYDGSGGIPNLSPQQ